MGEFCEVALMALKLPCSTAKCMVPRCLACKARPAQVSFEVLVHEGSTVERDGHIQYASYGALIRLLGCRIVYRGHTVRSYVFHQPDTLRKVAWRPLYRGQAMHGVRITATCIDAVPTTLPKGDICSTDRRVGVGYGYRIALRVPKLPYATEKCMVPRRLACKNAAMTPDIIGRCSQNRSHSVGSGGMVRCFRLLGTIYVYRGHSLGSYAFHQAYLHSKLHGTLCILVVHGVWITATCIDADWVTSPAPASFRLIFWVSGRKVVYDDQMGC